MFLLIFQRGRGKEIVDRHLGNTRGRDARRFIFDQGVFVYKLTDQEGARLVAALVAVRPDWLPNKPGVLLKEANDAGGLPGQDFGHCVRALAHYATQVDASGAYAKRIPDFYVEAGKHWTVTAPEKWQAPKEWRPCPDHVGQESQNCRCCWADVKAGQRPESHIGKHWDSPEIQGNEVK